MIEGIYIHIPFCREKCPYCDFYTVKLSEHDISEYIKCLIKELEIYLGEYEFNIKTLYIGGGSPSIISPRYYETILKYIYKKLGIPQEISIECNPEDYTKDDFIHLRDIGFNRVSFGIQTFSTRGLSILGRKHTPMHAIKGVEDTFNAGIENINADIIFGYPHQTVEELEKDIDTLITLPLKHLSAYLLTFYKDTPFFHIYKDFKRNEDELAEMHNLLCERLKEAGFRRYEISNWAKEGYVCKHNLMYWIGGEFLGVGVSAWSYADNKRWGNVRNINNYVDKLKRGEKPVEVSVSLKREDLFTEYIILGLRTMKGINKDSVFIPEHLREFFEISDSNISIKERYLLLADEIISELLCYNKLPREELCWKLKDLHP